MLGELHLWLSSVVYFPSLAGVAAVGRFSSLVEAVEALSSLRSGCLIGGEDHLVVCSLAAGGVWRLLTRIGVLRGSTGWGAAGQALGTGAGPNHSPTLCFLSDVDCGSHPRRPEVGAWLLVLPFSIYRTWV